MITKEIIKELEKEFPKNLAEEWDNVGLLVGDLSLIHISEPTRPY